MDRDSDGARQLSTLAGRVKQREIAAACGVKEATVSRWKNARRRPTAYRHRKALETLGIPPDAWDRAPEVAA